MLFKHLSRLRGAVLLAGLLLATACSADAGSQAGAPYTEGSEYVTLTGPAQRYSAQGKVEVVEVFSYGCIHCDHFAPYAEKLRKSLPEGAWFKVGPRPLRAAWQRPDPPPGARGILICIIFSARAPAVGFLYRKKLALPWPEAGHGLN